MKIIHMTHDESIQFFYKFVEEHINDNLTSKQIWEQLWDIGYMRSDDKTHLIRIIDKDIVE